MFHGKDTYTRGKIKLYWASDKTPPQHAYYSPQTKCFNSRTQGKTGLSLSKSETSKKHKGQNLRQYTASHVLRSQFGQTTTLVANEMLIIVFKLLILWSKSHTFYYQQSYDRMKQFYSCSSPLNTGFKSIKQSYLSF